MKIQCHHCHHDLKVPTKTREQNLLKISVQMQESGQHTDLMQLKDLYLQAIAKKCRQSRQNSIWIIYRNV